MSFDGLFTKAMSEEIASQLKGGRINKIHQPSKGEIIMIVRAGGKNHKLLLSAHPTYARVQLTNESYENPSEPPMFCMLLRKHLEGFILEDLYQIGVDRIIVLEIKGRNEIGDISHKKLIIEIMGRHSNIILVDRDRNMILDSIKHISPAINSYRTILPGNEYVAPPEQEKKNPFEATEETLLRTINFNEGRLDKQLVNSFAGISPLFSKETVYQAGLANRNTIPKAFLDLINKVKLKQYEPALINTNGKEIFYLIPLDHIKGSKQEFSSLSALLDRFYFGKAERDRVKQQSHDLERFISNEKKKNEKKIIKLEETLVNSEKAKEFQLFGELITANLYVMEKGMKEIEVINYYDEDGGMVTISLDPQKTPSENAQKYFSKYQKAKNSVDVVKEQIMLATEETAYFDSLLQQLEFASPKDISEIREELQEGGYLKAKFKKGTKSKHNLKPQLEKYLSSDGDEMYVGKNNKQNDYLTNKFSRRDDIWLHTKDIPGSHVVIRNTDPSEKTLLEAASLAAYFSKAKESSSVPVDFTAVRHVKKPNGSKPGFVIYDNQQTLYVTPDADKVIELRENTKKLNLQ
ncbi:putative ribosome quality control (RQC) complex YloA/Tae2 family protein [Peribacillus deserti]|uniref:Rqc2 homolog RqcH n=1 Tax=Peribacillus deserti TaxID=673318 RepID=A0ABS2QGP5_9BACI|nr:NFACT RNA binding domain-containing protein [Peribacillus deserti]MBM7692331.1 putative ribosome quality control (RQC) complex YloA/Tae2 family protein [Peribacillus deserti]